MNINISHTMNNSNFEHKENLKNAAKDILSKQNASQEVMQKIIDQSLFENNVRYNSNYINSQMSIFKASAQITQNLSLKETLKYLKNQAVNNNKKKHVLGELWNILNESEIDYNGELIDFEIDTTKNNIFIAA